MKFPALALAVLALLPAQQGVADADRGSTINVNSSCCDPPTRWAPRHDVRDARLAINSERGEAILLLTDRVVAVQLSDRVLRKLDRKMKQEQKEDESNILAQTLKTAVLSSVRALLDHSAECSIRDVKRVDYQRGRLIITAHNGERLFEDLEVDDRDVMEDFSESDARAFVREFDRLKRRTR